MRLYDIAKKFVDPKLWMFMGSGLIVSVAYIDPGNWGTNISAGSEFNYNLLWIIWLASGMAMLFQYLSGKLGIAGYSLPELIKLKIKNKTLVFCYWILSEIAILATDLAEFLGIVVALYLLFGIPMIYGAFVAIAEVLLFFFLMKNKFRNIEKAFILFVSIIGLSFLYEIILTKPDIASIMLHSIKPSLNKQSILIAVGIIGATVMPHALFVHSWLIRNKMEEFKNIGKKQVLRYHIIDNVSSLTIAGIINASMLIMAAAAFYQQGAVATLQDAYQTMIPLFGGLAATIFAIALLAAGISSSVTGTLSGQAIMDGLTDYKISPWVRRIITRFINVIPVSIALVLGLEPLDILVYSQAVLSLLILLPLIPIIVYTSDKRIMGELVNKKIVIIIAWIFAAVITAFNAYLIYALVHG